MDRQMTDREAYPAAWATLVSLGLGGLLWNYALGAPTISRCWIWEHWRIYCPGCGGTRAVSALAQGQILRALYCHAPVVAAIVLAAVYMISQTVWRLRNKQGWVLHYDPRWPGVLAGLLLGNCVLRNILWLGFGWGI